MPPTPLYLSQISSGPVTISRPMPARPTLDRPCARPMSSGRVSGVAPRIRLPTTGMPKEAAPPSASPMKCNHNRIVLTASIAPSPGFSPRRGLPARV